jgi:hypothetical protein
MALLFGRWGEVVNGDPFASGQFRDFEARIRRGLIPKLRDSALTVSIVPHETDVKFAVELGLSIMLDKPIILCVPIGVIPPPKLLAVADAVVSMEEGYEERMTDAINMLLGKDDTEQATDGLPDSEER